MVTYFFILYSLSRCVPIAYKHAILKAYYLLKRKMILKFQKYQIIQIARTHTQTQTYIQTDIHDITITN